MGNGDLFALDDIGNPGLLKSLRKKVMLLSATPLNNRPDDLENLLALFQDKHRSTIDGVTNLDLFFAPLKAKYKKLMRERDSRDVSHEVDKIYEQIRDKVIDKVTIRRTRNNILNDPDYKKDIASQGIVFPNILPPEEQEYSLTPSLSRSFTATLTALTDDKADEHITYARYRAVEFLKPEHRDKYKNAIQIGQSLAGIYRVHMVKRLESSFFAFKKSLQTLLRITNDMIRMFEEDKVIIAPELNIKDMMFKGMDLDEIIQYIIEKKGYKETDFKYKAEDFDEKFIKMLYNDRDILLKLNAEWQKIDEDPKLDKFSHKLPIYVSPETNPTGKLVIFSESVDTVNYLYDFLTETLGRNDVLKITAANRNRLFDTVKANFDANVPVEKQHNDYSIIITSDVLAEGVNLHRSNVIINYDSPWNASRLMQRIGRVNRIGSVADNIYNYMFYPSPDGDKQIQLYKNALIKLQGFHSAFGEDAQIYSREEIVKKFNLYDSNVKDIVDKKIALLRELRHLYNTNREWYHRIKNLPLKSRVMRDTGKHSGSTVVFVSSKLKTEFYLVKGEHTPLALDFLSAVNFLKAKPEEKAAPFTQEEKHYSHVNNAMEMFRTDLQAQTDSDSIKNKNLDTTAQIADKFLRTIEQLCEDDALKRDCSILRGYLKEGTYSQLQRKLKTISQEYKNNRLKIKAYSRILANRIGELVEEYHHGTSSNPDKIETGTPSIIISETFI